MDSKQMEQMAREHDMTGIDEELAAEVCQTVAEGTATGYKKIESGVVTGYKKIENGVVAGYKKLEKGVVDGFGKVTDACVKGLFSKEGETLEETKERLTSKGGTQTTGKDAE